MDSLGIIVGVPIGIICSFISWWITFHLFVPKIKFPEKIARLPEHAENITRHALVLENNGRRRIIDIEIKALVTIPGLFKDLPHIKHETYINTTFSKLPRIDSIKPNKLTKRVENKLMFRLLPHLSEEFDREIYPVEIREKRKLKTLTIDDIMGINSYVKINIILLVSIRIIEQINGIIQESLLLPQPTSKLCVVFMGLFSSGTVKLESNSSHTVWRSMS